MKTSIKIFFFTAVVSLLSACGNNTAQTTPTNSPSATNSAQTTPALRVRQFDGTETDTADWTH